MLKWITLVEANSNNKMEKNANTENHREEHLILTLRKNFNMGSFQFYNSLMNIATFFFSQL